MNVVIDTNIVIAALLKDSQTRKLLLYPKNDLYYPEISINEIEKYKPMIRERTGMTDTQLQSMIHLLLEQTNLIATEELKSQLKKAHRITKSIDEKDAPILAGALTLPKAIIWSQDKHFKQQKEIKAYTTEEIQNLTK